MTTIVPQNSINYHTNQKFRIIISNLPTVNNKIRDIKWLYENYVREFTIPGYKLNTIESTFQGRISNRPISRRNSDLMEFTVKFKADEHLYNYMYMRNFITNMRYNTLNQPTENVSQVAKRIETYDYNYDIDRIDFLVLDNEKRIKNTIQFKKIFINEMSELNFKIDNTDETSFDVSFKYEEIFMELPNDP